MFEGFTLLFLTSCLKIFSRFVAYIFATFHYKRTNTLTRICNKLIWHLQCENWSNIYLTWQYKMLGIITTPCIRKS